jgi:hypothetical protein
MKVTTKPDRFEKDKVIAKLSGVENVDGKVSYEYVGILCLFDRMRQMPERDATVEVMITGIRYFQNSERTETNFSNPKFFFVRETTDEDVLIAHDGFVISGKQTSAVAMGTYEGQKVILTAGRVGVVEIDQTGVKEGDPLPPGIPGHAYVRRNHLEKYLSSKGRGTVAIEGVPHPSNMRFAHVDNPNIV